jgi:exosortase/archaeosortase family protein
MSVARLTLPAAARDWGREIEERWVAAAVTTRTRIQVAVCLGAVMVAYHYSLSSLFQNLNLDTPLAYIGLVPIIALGLAVIRSRPKAVEPAIHDRQVDYIVGLPLVAAALAIEFLLPRRLSTMFWVWRMDLLSLPLFVAGVISIMFGVRALWRQKLTVAYLLLAWPVPYTLLLLNVLNSFTNVTLGLLRAAVRIVPVAKPVLGNNTVFQVWHHGQPFPLSVVSACSGVNGMVGFLLVGTAFAAIVKGPLLRKTVWLVGGLLLLWILNISRLLFIFWVGHTWGEHMAINVFHPFLGLVLFNLGVLFMILLLRPFGLRIGGFDRLLAAPVPASGEAAATTLAVPRILSAVAVVAVLGITLGVNNSTLRSYDLVANAAGEPKLVSYSDNPAAPDGWRASYITSFDWAKPMFGQSSTWRRYGYAEAGFGGDLHSSVPVVADVVNTNKLSSFSAYGVEACYRFHGYSLRDVGQVRLGGGVTGEALSYSSKKDGDWTIVWWIWPTKFGDSTHYERVILYMLNTTAGYVQAPGPVTGVKNLRGSLNGQHAMDERLSTVRAFLISFGREIVKSQAALAPGSRFVQYQMAPVAPTHRPIVRIPAKP